MESVLGQSIAPLPGHRAGPYPVFQSTALYKFQGTVNKRQTGKGWGVIIVCTATSGIYVESVESYSTDSFLMDLRRFMCLRGTPTRIQSDRGQQLVSTSKETETWDFTGSRAGNSGMNGIWCPQRAALKWTG